MQRKTAERKRDCCSVVNNILDYSPNKKLKMDSTLREEELPIILIQEYEIVSHIMGYHEYKSIWIPFVGEKLTYRTEPENALGKYAVAVIKNGSVVGHLMKGESDKFAKTIFYFLRLDELNSCTAVVTGKNKEDGMRMQIPCKLILMRTIYF